MNNTRAKSICLVAFVFLSLAIANPVLSAPFCVSTSSELSTALSTSTANGEDDIIRVQQGTYNGNFLYASTEAFGVTVEGGYTTGCVSRVVDATNTVLDAGSSGFVLRFGPPGSPSSATTPGNLGIDGITFQNGYVIATQGGGIAIRTDGDTNISNCIITDNQVVSSAGGGLFIYGQGNITLNNNIISNNTAQSGSSAGISISPCNILRILNNTISNNITASNNGGIFVSDAAEVYIDNNVIRDNVGEDDAGGLRIRRTDKVEITRNIIKDNSTNQQGGGIHLWGLQEVIIDSNIIQNNISKHGGGVWIRNTIMAILKNNIIAMNTANIQGAGIWLSWGDTTTFNFSVINNTVFQNSTNGDGGGIYIELMYESNIAEIYNNIIKDNVGNVGGDLFIQNDPNNYTIPFGIVNLRNNDFDHSASGTYIQIPFTIDPSNLDNVDPLFVDAENDDYHLTASSPCVNTGDNDAPGLPSGDKEGNPRIMHGIVDMGAYEYQGLPAPSLTVVSPNGGEDLSAGTTQEITWSSQGTVDNVKIEYSVNNGADWIEIVASTENDGSYIWEVPCNISDESLVRVSDADDSVSDESDAVFSISCELPPLGIDAIIEFFDESVADGSLIGKGKRVWIRSLRLHFMRLMLVAAKELFEQEMTDWACHTLNRALFRCDSERRPIDFVAGEAVPELNDMIANMISDIGCE